MTRSPTETLERGDPARPAQSFAPARCPSPLSLNETASTMAPTKNSSTSARRENLRKLPGGVGIETKIAGRLEWLQVTGGRGDHGRVVGAELGGRQSRTGKRPAQLGVGGHPARDGDRAGAGFFGRLQRSLDQGPYDRMLVGSGQIGTPALQLAGREPTHLVE